MEELSKCPVCGKHTVFTMKSTTINEWWVDCITCKYEGPSYSTESAAVRQYNAQCALLAHHLTPRANLAELKAERDTYAKMASKSEDTIKKVTEERDALRAKLAEKQRLLEWHEMNRTALCGYLDGIRDALSVEKFGEDLVDTVITVTAELEAAREELEALKTRETSHEQNRRGL